MKTVSLVGLLLALPAALANSFVPHKVSLEELSNPSVSSLLTLRDGLTKVGLISVSEIPRFAELREEILMAASNCVVHAQPVEKKGMTTFLEDGTKRYTLAAETSVKMSGVVEGADFGHSACDKFNELNAEFRGLVAEVTAKFANNIDDIIGAKRLGRKLMLDTETNKHVGSVSEIVQDGIQLEHFHTYERFSTSASKPEFAIDMHTDQGLFIALAPAMNLNDAASNDHGFYIELADGNVVQPHFGEGNNELVFMLGDGFTQWVTPKVDVDFRATPHAVVVPISTSGAALRSWYGRMVLPKASAFLEPQQRTFGQLRTAMVVEGINARHLSACSSDMVLVERNLQECNDGELFCWVRCQAAPCGDEDTVECAKENGGETIICDVNTHDAGCHPVCIPPVVDGSGGGNFSTIGNDFCNGFQVSMYMTGFESPGQSKRECIVFLFEDFVLDSAGKFVLACLVTLVIGVITELIVYTRRRMINEMADSSSKNTFKIMLYALQVTFGYIAMLIAMTYSIVLFLMIIAGLTLGHRLFNFEIVPEEHADPCCAPPVGKEADHKSV